jgi:hypothetical protein
LTIRHRVCLLHRLECVIIIIVNVHLFHLLHYCTAIEGLKPCSTSSLLWILVDEGYLRNLALVLHAFISSTYADPTYKTALRSTILGAVFGRRYVLISDVEMARRGPNPIVHILLLLDVQSAQLKRRHLVIWLEKLVLVLDSWLLKILVHSINSWILFLILWIIINHLRRKLFLHRNSWERSCLIRRFDNSGSLIGSKCALCHSWCRILSTVSPFISIVAEEYVVVVSCLLHHVIIDNIVKFIFMILVDVNASLTHLWALFVMIHLAFSGGIIEFLFVIKRLLLLWRLLLLIWSLIGVVSWRRPLLIELRWTELWCVLSGRRLNLVVLGLSWVFEALWGFILWPTLRLIVDDLLRRLDLALLAIILRCHSLSWGHSILHQIINEGICGLRRLFGKLSSTSRYRQISWRKMIFIRMSIIIVSSPSLRLSRSSLSITHLMHA